MSFSLPTFNITVDIYTCGGGGVVADLAAPPRVAGVAANLAFGRRTTPNIGGQLFLSNLISVFNQLLLPTGTDIRSVEEVGGNVAPEDGFQGDYIVVDGVKTQPYHCVGWAWIGKGFPNEHKLALIWTMLGTWTPPYV